MVLQSMDQKRRWGGPGMLSLIMSFSTLQFLPNLLDVDNKSTWQSLTALLVIGMHFYHSTGDLDSCIWPCKRLSMWLLKKLYASNGTSNDLWDYSRSTCHGLRPLRISVRWSWSWHLIIELNIIVKLIKNNYFFSISTIYTSGMTLRGLHSQIRLTQTALLKNVYLRRTFCSLPLLPEKPQVSQSYVRSLTPQLEYQFCRARQPLWTSSQAPSAFWCREPGSGIEHIWTGFSGYRWATWQSSYWPWHWGGKCIMGEAFCSKFETRARWCRWVSFERVTCS